MDDYTLRCLALGVLRQAVTDATKPGTPAPIQRGARVAPDLLTIQTIQPIPEPASMLLLGTGLMGLAGAVRCRVRK